jgi:NAD(P) transhydrogenase subunit alpha
VTILGPVNLPSTVPQHASQMHGRNVASFLGLLVSAGELKIDLEDEIVRETLVVRDGGVVHPRVRDALGLPSPASRAAAGR